MKKTILILALISASTFILPSCKKKYTCVCTVNGNEVYRNDLGKQTHDDAVDACNEKAIGFGIIAKCEVE